jgi:hypothetical protein
MSLLVGISIRTHIKNSQLTLTEQAIYTESFAWSLSGQEGSVEQIYTNESHTKAFILCKTDDMTSLTTSASDYQMFLTGYKGKLNNNPTGAIYIFGSTGYMGFYLVDQRGFSPAMYDLVIRNTKLVTSETGDVDTSDMDVSFSKYNQIRIYANLGASGAVTAKFLDNENATVSDIYAETVAVAAETEYKDKLAADLVQMNNDVSKLEEYKSRLNSLGVYVPELPKSIAGDLISEDSSITKDNPVEFDESMIDATTSSVVSADENISEQINDKATSTEDDIATAEGATTEAISDDTAISDSEDTVSGEAASGEEETPTLYLKTNYVFPNGYNFDWQSFDINSDFVTDLIGDKSFSQYVNTRKQEVANFGGAFPTSLNKNDYVTWTTLQGDSFDTDDADSIFSDKDTEIQNNINNYVDTLFDYYNTKYTYQVTDLFNLLKVSYNAHDSVDLFDVNTDEDVLLMY